MPTYLQQPLYTFVFHFTYDEDADELDGWWEKWTMKKIHKNCMNFCFCCKMIPFRPRETKRRKSQWRQFIYSTDICKSWALACCNGASSCHARNNGVYGEFIFVWMQPFWPFHFWIKKSIFFFAVSSWHAYQERLFADPIYTSLKLQCPQQGQQGHLPNPFPDSTSHLTSVNLADSSVAAAAAQAASYHHHHHHHHQYATFRHQHAEANTVVSSTEPDYGSGIGTTIQNGGSTGLNQISHGINLHQRRGKLGEFLKQN